MHADDIFNAYGLVFHITTMTFVYCTKTTRSEMQATLQKFWFLTCILQFSVAITTATIKKHFNKDFKNGRLC